jgi:hypothetical protein
MLKQFDFPLNEIEQLAELLDWLNIAENREFLVGTLSNI